MITSTNYNKNFDKGYNRTWNLIVLINKLMGKKWFNYYSGADAAKVIKYVGRRINE